MDTMVPKLNEFAGQWWVYVAHATWQATLLASLVLVLIAVLRRFPPTWRYGLLLIALAKFAVPPLFSPPVGLLHWVGPEVLTPAQPLAASRPFNSPNAQSFPARS